MSKYIAFITDPLDQIDRTNSSTLAFMLAAQELGYQVLWMESSDLHLKHNVPLGYMSSIHIDQEKHIHVQNSFLGPLNELSLIWWRKSPPYSLELLFALDALQMVSSQTLVLNNPTTLRHMNEHLFSLQFPEFVPPTLVSKNSKAIQSFISKTGGKIVIRRLDSPSHLNNFYLRIGDPNLNMLTQVLTGNGTQYVFAQKLITEHGLDGDKRVFMIDGEILGSALQIPATGEMRGCFERGAQAAKASLTEKDLNMLNKIGPILRKHGIFFATLDIAEGLIFDFNYSSPEGILQLQSVMEENVLENLFQRIANKINER